MANTRFKGANASERLTLSTLSDSDMFQTRHLPGTVNDADKGVSKALLQALPVAICSTAAATAAKVGTLAAESCPDFALISGRAVQVYFSTANTASTPTLNLYGTGAIPIVYPDGSFVKTWGAGIWMILMYVSVTIDGTLTQRWVAMDLPVDEVAADNMNSVTSNAVAEALNYSETEVNTGVKWIDGKPIYRKVFVHEETGSSNPSFDYGTISSFGQLIEAKTITVSNSGDTQEVEFMSYRRSRAVISNGIATFINEPQITYNVDKYILIVEYTKTTD